MLKISHILLLSLSIVLFLTPDALGQGGKPKPCACPSGFKQYCTKWEEDAKPDFGYELNHVQFGQLAARMSPSDAKKCVEFSCLLRFDVHGEKNERMYSRFAQNYPVSRHQIKYKQGTEMKFRIKSKDAVTTFSYGPGSEEWNMETGKRHGYQRGMYRFVTDFGKTKPADQHAWIWVNLKCPAEKKDKPEPKPCACPEGFKQYCTKWEEDAKPDFGYELNHVQFTALPLHLSAVDAKKCVEFSCLRRFDVHGDKNSRVQSRFDRNYPMSRHQIKYKQGTEMKFRIKSEESTTSFSYGPGSEEWNMESHKYHGYRPGMYRFVTDFGKTKPADQHAWIWVNLKCPVKKEHKPKPKPCACPTGFKQYCTKFEDDAKPDFGYELDHKEFTALPRKLSRKDAKKCVEFSCLRRFDVHGDKNSNIRSRFEQNYPVSRHQIKYRKGTETKFRIKSEESTTLFSYGPGSEVWNMESGTRRAYTPGMYRFVTDFGKTEEAGQHAWIWVNLKCPNKVQEKPKPKPQPCACPEGFKQYCTKLKGSNKRDFGYDVKSKSFNAMSDELPNKVARRCEEFSCLRQFDVHGDKNSKLNVDLPRNYGQGRHFVKYQEGTEFHFNIKTKDGDKVSRTHHGPLSAKWNMEELVSPGKVKKGEYILETNFCEEDDSPRKSWNWINLSCAKPKQW